MKAQAMRSPKGSQEPEVRQKDAPPDDRTHESPNEETDADDGDFDESDLQDADDDRWDVFILDNDGEPLPDYGDFWFPD
jgi:hypothetical protein